MTNNNNNNDKKDDNIEEEEEEEDLMEEEEEEEDDQNEENYKEEEEEEEKEEKDDDNDEKSSSSFSYASTSDTSLDEDDSQYSYLEEEEEEEEEEEMPLFKYARIVGSLPRQHQQQHQLKQDNDIAPSSVSSPPLEVPCTCITMGKVTLSASDIAAAAAKVEDHRSSSSSQQTQQHTTATTRGLSIIQEEEAEEKEESTSQPKKDTTNISSQRRYDIVALGFANGDVRIIDPRTGGSILKSSSSSSSEGGGGGGGENVLRVAASTTTPSTTTTTTPNTPPPAAPALVKTTSLFGFTTSSSSSTPTKQPRSFSSPSSSSTITTTPKKALQSYTPTEKIVALTFDSTGTFLAAINANGDAAIFEFKYAPTSLLFLPPSSGTATDGEGSSSSSTSERLKGVLVEASNAASAAVAAADKEVQGGGGGGGGGGFSTFFSQFATAAATTAAAAAAASPRTTTPTTTTPTTSTTTTPTTTTTTLANLSISNHPTIPTSKFHYSRNTHSIPTCLALDPSYGRRREKVTLVGFADGRLVLTKRAGLSVFSRRNDSVLYQGAGGGGGFGSSKRRGGNKKEDEEKSGGGGEGYGGVECVVWRGALVAWADSSGIKIYDIEQLQRIAHVDRPTGARSTLYPTISSLRPSLVFEKSDSLIFAWGDCIMGMNIKEKTPAASSKSSATAEGSTRSGGDKSSGGGGGGGGDTQTPVVKKRTVELSMAWELDCVASGVVPLDGDHVAVLGLVPIPSSSSDDDDEEDGEEKSEKGAVEAKGAMTEAARAKGDNILELQILSRSTGMVTSSDALPLLVVPSSATTKTIGSSASGGTIERSKIVTDAASEYSFVSSFAVPRMDDVIEAEEESEFNEEGEDEDEFDMSMFNIMTGGSGAVGGGGGGAGVAGVDASDTNKSKRRFIDPHVKWSIRSVTYDDDDDDDNDEDNLSGKENDETSVKSTYSDDYTFLFQPQKASKTSAAASAIPTPAVPPIMVVSSPSDAVLVRTRDVDDAISFARAKGRHGLALRRALKNKRKVRRHCLNELINEYLMAVLCLNRQLKVADGGKGGGNLTVSRIQTAARATPMLLGSSISMWERWVYEFAKIPGGLFVLREYLPVRDPKLPSSLYEMILEKMLIECESILSKSTRGKKPQNNYLHGYAKSAQDAADLYLNTLRAWGTTSSIRERINLHKLFYKQRLSRSSWTEKVFDPALKQAEIDLHVRMNQTAVGYLLSSPAPRRSGLTSRTSASDTRALRSSIDQPTGTTSDALFDMIAVSSRLSSRLPPTPDNTQNDMRDESTQKASEKKSNAYVMIIEAMAEVEFMQGHYDEALKLFLAIGAQFASVPLSSLEDEAVRSVKGNGLRQDSAKEKSEGEGEGQQPTNNISSPRRYQHVLAMIESHHMHRSLFDEDQIKFTQFEETNTSSGKNGSEGVGNCSPIVAFIRLVGLDLSGRFLVENCVPPQVSVSPPPKKGGKLVRGANKKDPSLSGVYGERSANLPLNMVAGQLRATPKLLHWYLHQIFVHKPEIYVKFPNTAVPPKEITDLHRIHLESYIKYAEEDKSDKERTLSDVPAYDAAEVDTPLMAFLKAALPYGGARPDDVRSMLEERRRTKTGSSLFARELAFVIKKSGSDTEKDSKKILELYLEGAKSLPMAVEYAEQNTKYSTVLWERLVARCLQPQSKNDQTISKNDTNKVDGSLFGALLEVAARCGADLAHLVSQIPEGMVIEGIRPRLVAAVADYRLKLKIHKSASDVLSEDKIVLLRELCHRSRRGLRVAPHAKGKQKVAAASTSANSFSTGKSKTSSQRRRSHGKSNTQSHTRSRGHRHACSLPIR